MNKVRVFILGLLFMLLVCFSAAIHTGIRLQKDLTNDRNKIYAGIRQVQSTLLTEAKLADLTKNMVNPLSKMVSVNVLVDNAENVGKITPSDLIKNTLLQRSIRSSIDNGTSALDDLQKTANLFGRKQKEPEIKELLDNLESVVKQNQESRDNTIELIKNYNAKFDSIPTILIASIMGYNKFPVVYIM